MCSAPLQSFFEIAQLLPSLGTGRILLVGLADTTSMRGALAAGLDAHGMAISDAIATAAAAITPGRVRVGTVSTLPYEDNHFERVVVLTSTFPVISRPEREALLGEARRTSRGQILLSMSDSCGQEIWADACAAVGLHTTPLALSRIPAHGVHHVLWETLATEPAPDRQRLQATDPMAWLLGSGLPPPKDITFHHPETSGLVSVIVPVYNGATFLERTLGSVWDQTLPAEHIEIIVADDGSSDGSLERIRDLSAQSPVPLKVLTHPRHENRGVSATRNLCFQHAAGQYVALLDADDRFLPRRLEASRAYLEAHPECQALCARGYNVDATGNRIVGYTGTEEVGNYRDYSPELRPPFSFEQLWKICPIANSTVTLRRQALGLSGGYPEQMAHQAEDWLLMLKLCLSAPIAFLDEPLIQYTHHAESYTSRFHANQLDYGCRVEVFHLLTYWMLQHPITRQQGIEFYRREYPEVMGHGPLPDLRDVPGIMRRAAGRGFRLGPTRSVRMLWNSVRQSRARARAGKDA